MQIVNYEAGVTADRAVSKVIFIMRLRAPHRFGYCIFCFAHNPSAELISASHVEGLSMATKAAKKRPENRRKAATSEVLGAVQDSEKINPKWQSHYTRLMDLHARLLNRKEDLVQDAVQEKPAFSLHMADAATDAYDQDFALSMISSEQDALYEVEEAMARVKDGTYGVCQLTGKPIEMERLNAIPWTRFSAQAERELEQEGAVDHARLGVRQQVPRDTPEEGEEG